MDRACDPAAIALIYRRRCHFSISTKGPAITNRSSSSLLRSSASAAALRNSAKSAFDMFACLALANPRLMSLLSGRFHQTSIFTVSRPE